MQATACTFKAGTAPRAAARAARRAPVVTCALSVREAAKGAAAAAASLALVLVSRVGTAKPAKGLGEGRCRPARALVRAAPAD